MDLDKILPLPENTQLERPHQGVREIAKRLFADWQDDNDEFDDLDVAHTAGVKFLNHVQNAVVADIIRRPELEEQLQGLSMPERNQLIKSYLPLEVEKYAIGLMHQMADYMGEVNGETDDHLNNQPPRV